MPTSERKPPGGADFHNPDDLPENLLATVREAQQNLANSAAWPIVAPDRGSVAEALDRRPEIAVEVHCGVANHGEKQMKRNAKLARRTGANGQVEFCLNLDAPLPAEFETFAMGVCPLDTWQFAAAKLGEMPSLQRPPSTVQSAPEPTFALSASGHKESEGLEAKTDRVFLRWRANELQIIAARPPRYFGQPVVAEISYIDHDGEYRSYRRAVSLDRTVASGEYAGRFWGGFDCHVPARTKQFQIEVRPIASDELDLLESPQLEAFLGGQYVTTLLAAGGGEVSAVAEWEDQQLAVLDRAAAWFLLAARKAVR